MFIGNVAHDNKSLLMLIAIRKFYCNSTHFKTACIKPGTLKLVKVIMLMK